MKLSNLLKRLYEESEYESVSTLSDATQIGKGFIDRAFAGKNTMEKLDVLFDELTSDLDAEDFLLTREIIKKVKLKEIEKTQIF